MSNLTLDDCYFIITSLDFTISAFQEYTHYPSYEFKLERIKEAEDIRWKMRGLRDDLKKADAHA